MKAFVVEDFDSEPTLRDGLARPDPGAGEVAVRVLASSVNPVDNAIAAGRLRGMAEHEFPVTLGRDFAGLVEAVGDRVETYAVEDEVFGYLLHADPIVRRGSWAEVAVTAADGFIARKPERVEFAEAGAAPLAAITAINAVDALDLREGETVLIVGATGGVGTFAVQLAKLAGARVIAPGLSDDAAYLRDLGVDEVLDRDGDVAGAARELEPDGVAALIDVVSFTPDGLEVFAAALVEQGRVASTVGAAGEGPGRHNVMASADVKVIDRLAELLEAGRLRVPLERRYRLEDAGAGLSDLASEHTQGKLGITITHPAR